MAHMDDTLTALNRLEKTIREQRQLLLQAHGVLTCLYEVLLHAECDEAVAYAQAAFVARGLVDRGAEEVDSVRIGPLFDALAPVSNRVDESRVLYVT
jgi:sulfur transfer complex TusBCD TusB component (DsrH family)